MKRGISNPVSILSLTVALLLSGAAASAQPEPWRHPDNTIHWYDAVAAPNGIGWREAMTAAGKLGGYLATLTSVAENSLVAGMCDKDSLWYLRPDRGILSGPWLGGYQLPGSRLPDEGWAWVTGEPFNLRNWSSGEPDDFGGEEDALHFGGWGTARVSTWADLASGYRSNRGYAIELSAETTTVGLIRSDSGTCPGYTMLAPLSSNQVYLLDIKGRPVHRWQCTDNFATANYLLADGRLLRIARGVANGRIEILDWNSNPVWSFVSPSGGMFGLHHDAIYLPSGNILAISYETKTRAEAIAAGRKPARLIDNYIIPDKIIEVNPTTNTIVWEWHVWDHLIQDFDSTKANYGVVRDHPELIDINFGPTRADWLHCNSLDYNAEFDQIILTSRHLSEFWVIDHSTTTEQARGHTGGRYGMGGDILYRWGNPQVYRAGDSTTQRLFGPHNTHWIRSGLRGAGHLLVFNNGWLRPGGYYSTVEELVLPCDSTGRYSRPAPGQPFEPVAPVWVWGATPPNQKYSATISGAQRLPNGNTLICNGEAGDIFEIGPDSTILWEYVNPVSDTGPVRQSEIEPNLSVFRALRYPADYPGLAGRELRPGYPLERYDTPPLALSNPPNIGRTGSVTLAVGPNPTRSAATIHYSLPAPGPLRITVHDGSGRLIRTIKDDERAAASGSVVWDGTDENRQKVGTGVYLYLLSAGDVTRACRLILMR